MIQLTIKPRRFLPQDFKVSEWSTLQPYAQKLLDADISTRAAFDQFLLDQSEFSGVVEEESNWRYIRNSTHTNDEAIKQAYEHFITTISPPMAEWGNALNQKILASPFIELPKDDAERLLFRRLKMAASLFRSENVALATELEKLSSDSDQIRGAMTITLDGETMTPQKAATRLFWPDRAKREEAWHAIQDRRLQDKDQFDAIFDQMVKKRHQMALNAGYKNYRDYKFDSLERFDYTPEDCFSFHAAVEKHIVPILSKLNAKRAKRMNLDQLRPWDGSNDPQGRPALKAFQNVDDMVEKGIAMLDAIDPLFGDVVRLQRDANRLDLDSREHKRPGGYNCGMPESIVPFMFANVTSQVGDVETFIHEAGHATHNILMEHIPLGDYKSYPMEIAEVASMTMELFAFDKWHIFFDKTEDKLRAQEEFLTTLLYMIPWMAQIDLYQHEIYTHPDWTIDERHAAWNAIVNRFAADGVDRSGLDEEFRTQWQRQGHIFSVPFYYIEYAIAQLGALQLWRNYLADPVQTIAQYKAALALGYTKPLPELYATAGIKFDFSPAMVAELVPFLMKQLEQFD